MRAYRLWALPVAAAALLALAPGAQGAAPAGTPFRVNGQPMRAITLTDLKQFSSLSIPDLPRLKADGFNTVTLYAFRTMDQGTSDGQHTGVITEPDASLEATIDAAHRLGLAVQLIPTVWVYDGIGPFYWRGAIAPTDTNAFFDSYRAMLDHYADLATAHHVELFGLGSEMRSLEPLTAQWQHTVTDVRTHYRGPLTYFAIWASVQTIHWWGLIDVPGVSPYMSLASGASPTYDAIANGWRTSVLPYLRQDEKYVGRPLAVSEIGYGSGAGAATHPEVKPSGVPDDRLQADLYRSLLQIALKDKAFDGVSLYRWSSRELGPADPGYSLKSKPAECVLVAAWAAPNSASRSQCDRLGLVVS